jgi:hypothetical protein
MKKWDRTCGICFDMVCFKCCDDYRYSRTDSDCSGNGVLYWRFDRARCEVGSGNHFSQ